MRLSLLTALVVALAALVAPSAEALPARDIAGVALHPWRMENADVRERTFAGLRAVGVRLARVDLSWNFVERRGPSLRSGRANWTAMDAIVETADRHGITLLPMLAYTPPWASASGELWAYPEAQSFEAFFAAALGRYPQIPAWEIWNEPNLAVFAKPSPDPAGFVELLRSARLTRDAMGSRAKLIAGGITPGGEIGIVDWVDELARRGGLELVDGLGVHPYSPLEPDDPRAWMMRLERLHGRLAALGQGDLPMWLTEYGAPNTPLPSGYAPPLTEEQQAERLRRAFALAERLPWVENLTWFEYRDSCGDPANPECNFGLVREDLSPKPAYHALSDVMAGARAKLRPRLALRSRVAGDHRARWVRLSGRLLLPGSPAPTTRLDVRLMGRGEGAPRLSIRVHEGRFSGRVRAPRRLPRTVQVHYRGSRAYRRALASSRVERP
jgi:polysaccharide biosynthesis protein PslG